MASKDGTKTGGRKKGTPNKASLDARAIADRLGCDPFEVLIHFAKGDWEALGYEAECKTRQTASGEEIEGAPWISPETRVAAAREAVQYLLPKRKALELSVKSPVEQEAEEFAKLSKEEQANLLEKEAKRLKGEV